MGTHTAYPDQAIILLDESYLDVGFPDIEAITAGKMGNLKERVKEHAALVSVRDLQRFQTALKRLSDRVSEVTFEIQMAERSVQIRAFLAQAKGGEPT